MAVYDRIGVTYAETRRPDPRIDAAIRAALGGARSVVNVGAGSGSYEPPETVLAVEPSEVMIAQRPAGLAPAVQATAEAIPLSDGAVDAALAVLTIHHWPDLARGFAEMRRVAGRIVVLTWDPSMARSFWLSREYLPDEAVEWDIARCPPLETVTRLIGPDAAVTPCRCRTTARTASSARSGGGPRRTSIQSSGPGSRTSPTSATRWRRRSSISRPISTPAPGIAVTRICSSSTSWILATGSLPDRRRLRRHMAEYRVTRWAEIPSLVTARDGGGGTAKVELPQRFQEAIDDAAMRRGMAGSDAYLEQWHHDDWREADGSADEVAGRIAAELDDEHPPDRLEGMLDG